MRIGMIFHGPEIVDTGSAKKIINIFKRDHDVIAKLGGTMGRTAVIDAGLENNIDISRGITPSETIKEIQNEIDLIILLNHGKTLDTGRLFGSIVASRLKTTKPFVHIESPDINGRIIYYHSEARRCAEFVRNYLLKNEKDYNLCLEQGTPEPSYVRISGDHIIRSIRGAFKGESIRLEGVVIGRIMDSDIEIICKDGKISSLKGIKEKPHGIEKLRDRKIDLFKAKVKTGDIRRTLSRPKINSVDLRRNIKKIALIDHAAESTFELVKDAGFVITIGDDTTSIASDILVRLGIPVIGIIDGDLDGILQNNLVPAGSVIIRLQPGFDDIAGRQIFEILMQGKQQATFDTALLKEKIISLVEEYIVEVKYY